MTTAMRFGKRTLLLVEDDGLVMDSLRTRLSGAGFVVHTARNGNEALKQLVSVRPDAMILDINMPEMDGFSVLEVLRQELPHLRVPVLVLTARNTADDVKRAIELGARDYVVKTQLEAELLGRVERLFRTAKAA